MEDWARNVFERKSVELYSPHPDPRFKKTLTNMAVSL